MKTYLNDKRLSMYLRNKKIKVIIDEKINDDGKVMKTFYLDVPDSSVQYTGIKAACDETIDMEIGDDFGICAHLMPYSYNNTNPFKLTTSDKNVVDVDNMVLTAKSAGTATITVTSMNDKFSDSITVNVSEPYTFSPSTSETYTVEPDRFGLIPFDGTQATMDAKTAFINSNAIKSIFIYANKKGYKKVVFPASKIYYYDPNNRIYLKNNLIVNLNGSTLQIYPNYLYTYTGIILGENSRMVNVAPRGWGNIEDTGYIKYVTAYGPDEYNNNRYWYAELLGDYYYDLKYTSGGESGTVYLNDKIPVVDTWDLNQYNQYRNFIERDCEYDAYLFINKYRVYENRDDNYTSNNVEIIAECYNSSDSLVATKTLKSISWNKNIGIGNVQFKINLSDTNCSYIKVKVTGMSDPNYPVNAILGDLKIYKKDNVSPYNENIVFENGNLLGDKSLKNDSGEEYKTTIFKEKYGSDWRNISKTEGSMNLELKSGKFVGCRNMVIGDTPGFNIGLGYGEAALSYYKNANLFEIGGFDDNGENCVNDSYVRSSEPYNVDISKTPYFIITDPTYSVSYYFGYRSRIIDVYFYDENMNFIKSLKGKFRHGLLKAPEGTKYINLAIPLEEGESLNTSGHGDFNNSIFSIKFMYRTDRCFFKNCEIKNNYSCGMAHSGMSILVENCNFHDNVGRMPWADVDSEDGWVRMQNNVFRGNSFNSYYGFIMCAGTNYVIKNNTFNCPYLNYSDCQYFKIVDNTFNNKGYIGASGLGTMADQYICGNTFNNTPVSPGKNHSNANYGSYFYNNTLNNTTIGMSDTNSVTTKNKLSGDILINSKTSELLNDKPKEYFSNVNSLTINSSLEYNNTDFGEVTLKLKNGTTSTFNNCTFNVLPTSISGTTIGNSVFNNCTITNAKIDSKYTYNDCIFNNGIIDKYLLPGIITDNLVFTQTHAAGTYMGIQDTNIKKFKDWTAMVLLKKRANYHYNVIDSDFLKLGMGASKNSASVQIWATKDGGVTNTKHMWSAATPNDAVGDNDTYVGIVTYNSQTKTYTLKINNVTAYSYSIPSDSEPSTITSDIGIGGQCDALYYYLYDRLLTDEEITTNYEIMKNSISNFVYPNEINLNENNEEYQISLSIDNRIVGDNEEVTITPNNYNVDLNSKKLTFTKDNYNVPQVIRLKTNYDPISSSDKNTKITISSPNIQTRTINVNISNTSGSNDSIEADIKSQYPQCTNFKGSFDWDSLTSNSRDSFTKGDFWVNDLVNEPVVYDSRVHFPNNIVYFDGTYLQPLYRNKFTDTTVQEEYDVCIVGGGAGGIGTAYALKDKGLKVCLIDKLEELGGTHIHASIPVLISTPINGTWYKDIVEDAYNIGMVDINMFSGRKEGVGEGTQFEKLWRSSLYCNHCNERGVQWNVSMGWFSNRYYQDLHNSVDIKLRTEFIESTISNGKITSIKVKSLDTNTEYYINAKYFVDCSADGVLCRSGKTLNTDFFIGTDDRARFGETAYEENEAPNIYGINTVESGYLEKSSGYKYKGSKDQTNDISGLSYTDIGKGVNGATEDPQCRQFRSISPTGNCAVPAEIFIDNGNDYALEWSKDRARYHSATRGGGGGYLQQNKMLGIRESYRIKCDYMCTQTDCEHRVVRDDIVPNHIIALSTWYTDLHNATTTSKNSGFNGIPYESLVASAYTNVLVASRCFGCSHIAQASFRLTKTMMSLGYAAGNALSQCVINNIENVRNIDIPTLQQDVEIFELFDEVNEYIQLWE